MKIKEMTANVIIVILSIVMMGSVGIFCSEVYSYHKNYYPEESSFLYCLQEQNYARMVEMMYQNEVSGAKLSDTYKECYAVAKYYEAATYYKAYQEVGNEKLAEEKKQIMEEQATLMGELSYAAEDIMEILKIR